MAKVKLTARDKKTMAATGHAFGIREANAREKMLETMMVLGEMSRADAESAFAYYAKHKLFNTRDVFVNGQLRVKHGACLDKDVLRRAAAMGHKKTQITMKQTPFTCRGCGAKKIPDGKPKNAAFVWTDEKTKTRRPYCYECDDKLVQGVALPKEVKRK